MGISIDPKRNTLNLVTCMMISIASWNPTNNQVGISNGLHLYFIKYKLLL